VGSLAYSCKAHWTAGWSSFAHPLQDRAHYQIEDPLAGEGAHVEARGSCHTAALASVEENLEYFAAVHCTCREDPREGRDGLKNLSGKIAYAGLRTAGVRSDRGSVALEDDGGCGAELGLGVRSVGLEGEEGAGVGEG
jgi:hypothetical protein